MHSDHDSHNSSNLGVIDEKSIQDKILAALAAIVLIGLFVLGAYWQSLPLPSAETESESHQK